MRDPNPKGKTMFDKIKTKAIQTKDFIVKHKTELTVGFVGGIVAGAYVIARENTVLRDNVLNQLDLYESTVDDKKYAVMTMLSGRQEIHLIDPDLPVRPIV